MKKYLWMLSAAVVIVALRIKTHLDTWNYLEAKSHFIDELHKIDNLHFLEGEMKVCGRTRYGTGNSGS